MIENKENNVILSNGIQLTEMYDPPPPQIVTPIDP